MMKLLLELKEDMKVMKGQLNTILQQTKTGSVESEEEEAALPPGVVLPCTTIEELLLFDGLIKTDRDLQRHVVSILRLWQIIK